jgi:uncharacterized protein
VGRLCEAPAASARRAYSPAIELGTYIGGAAIAFAIALVATPAGVSGAVLLVPIQVSVLGVANPAVTPTNLLYNVLAIPGSLLGYGRRATTGGRLTRTLVLGTLPGVVVGAVLRVEVLPGPHAFYWVIAAVLGPLGAWLLLDSAAPTQQAAARASGALVSAIALVVGVVGGIYGIGGGSILAPILVAFGYSVIEVAPAALAATFMTSIVGIVAFGVLSIDHTGSIAPDWTLGVALGVGGLLGGFSGARLQRRLPETTIRRTLGALSILLGLRYLALGLG